VALPGEFAVPSLRTQLAGLSFHFLRAREAKSLSPLPRRAREMPVCPLENCFPSIPKISFFLQRPGSRLSLSFPLRHENTVRVMWLEKECGIFFHPASGFSLSVACPSVQQHGTSPRLWMPNCAGFLFPPLRGHNFFFFSDGFDTIFSPVYFVASRSMIWFFFSQGIAVIPFLTTFFNFNQAF